MSTPTTDGLKQEIDQGRMRVGNQVQTSTGALQTASTAMYVDSNSNLATGNLPFTLPLFAGVTDTSFSVFSVEGSTTGSANELMHQTLVLGSSVTTFTKTGFIRVTVTDDAGNITNGAHYIQIGTLS